MAKWIQAAADRMKKKGTVGSFRRIADRMGKSTGEAASTITANPEDYPESTRKKAQFAANVAK